VSLENIQLYNAHMILFVALTSLLRFLFLKLVSRFATVIVAFEMSDNYDYMILMLSLS
jgi:hypothetical protein